MKITKRNGQIVEFDKSKISAAVNKAYLSIYGTTNSSVGVLVADFVTDEVAAAGGITTVEQVQDLVEDWLISHCSDTSISKEYIRYRHKRKLERQKMQIEEKLLARNVQNQNANVDEYSFGGRIGETASVVTKQYALENLVSPKARYNHEHNRIYIHDLGSYATGMHNCLSIPFDDLLAKGFNTRQTDVRPANSVNTAFQLVAVIFQIQSLQQFGGVSATHLDWTMVPYVRKSFVKHFKDGLRYCEDSTFPLVRTKSLDDSKRLEQLSIYDDYFLECQAAHDYALDMTIRETYQAVEGLFHNLNTLQSRSGNQLPFTSINYGTCTLPEGRLIIEAILKTSITGLGKLHKTSIFPCHIFQLMKGVNRKPGDKNYDLYQLALESTAKRLYPNYANVDWSGNAGYDRNDPRTYFSTMGCRTANGWDINGFGQLKDGRGNICPVTIIMPTLAMEAKEWLQEASSHQAVSMTKENMVKVFLDILSDAIDDAKDMLIERFNWICAQNPSSANFMYENGTMLGYIPEEGIRSALKHGTLALGQLGLAETLQILIDCDHTSNYGMEVAKQIEQLFKDKCAKFKEQHRLNFGVYYTPAENLCYTAMQKFKKEYGVIPNVSENDFFTNSMHVPVWKEMSPFDKIDIESKLTGYSSAGCITYVELDTGIKNNLKALEQIINYAMGKDIPYFAINVPNDTCLDCGYMDEFNNSCPECGSHNIQQLRRVTGYLTGNYKTAFNKGKQQEVEKRVKHL